MRTYKIFLTLMIGLTFLSGKSLGQKGYLVIDSTYSTGFVDSQGKKLNTREVKFRKSSKSPAVTYNPSTANEYGFNDKVYKSKKISTGTDSTAYFLYVLSSGNTSLYTIKLNGKKRFFIENEKELLELKREGDAYRQQIASLSEKCEAYKNYLPYLSFKEKALKRFFTLQNKCYDKGPWPLLRWSGVAGFSTTNLTIQNVYGEEVNMGNHAAPFFGFGLETPLGTQPNWSMMIHLLYQQNNYQKSVDQVTTTEVRVSDYDIKMSSITAPFQVKYAVPFNKINGFVSLGPSLSYNLNDSQMHEEIERSSGTTTNDDSSDLVTKITFGGAAGLGLEYFINAKISVSIEGRFSTGMGFGTDGHSVSAKQILIAVNF